MEPPPERHRRLPDGQRLLPRAPLRTDEQLLHIDEALAGLLPGRGLRRGSVLAVRGAAGATSLLLALLARPLAEGAWGAVLGWPELGLEAAAGLGVRLDRLALVPQPGPAWPEVAATLVDAVDLVVVRPPSRLAIGVARRLAARARERGCVVVVVVELASASRRAPSGAWPDAVDGTLEAVARSWHGVGDGFGTLHSREVVVRSSGRRLPGAAREVQLLLPDIDGTLTAVTSDGEAAPQIGHEAIGRVG